MLEHLNAAAVAPTRVVVMGAAGFIGGAIAARLARDGVPVLALGRADIDLLAPDAAARLAALLRPDDAFVAASAKAPVKNSDMLVDNVIMARALVQALAKTPVAHVLNISSDAIYADSDSPLTEASCAAPGSLHGAMHMAREVMFQSEVKAPLAMLRPTLVYGPGDPHNGYGPNRFRRLAAQGEEIVLFGNGEERRDHVTIDDVAELAVRMLFRRSVGALNAATGTVISFREIAETVVRLAARPVAIRPTPRSGPMPHNGYRAFDAASVQRAFPGFVFTPFEDGLRRSLAAD
jgi:UDP-glucose 4-epimerase